MDAAANAVADIAEVPLTAGEEPRLSDAVAPVLESEAQMFGRGLSAPRGSRANPLPSSRPYPR